MNNRKLPKKPARANGREAPYAYSGLQRIFHERGRLAVCTCLVAHPEGLSFTDLQDSCGLTDGNLSRHLAALAEMEVVTITKETGHGLSRLHRRARGGGPRRARASQRWASARAACHHLSTQIALKGF